MPESIASRGAERWGLSKENMLGVKRGSTMGGRGDASTVQAGSLGAAEERGGCWTGETDGPEEWLRGGHP